MKKPGLMEGNIDFTKVLRISQMRGDDEEDTKLLQAMAPKAERYISGFTWCREIVDEYFGLGVGGVVAVFLFHIIPSRQDVDNYIWVVVGDIPPLYITTEDAPNPACALDGYIGAMQKWADAAIAGGDVSRLAPVNVEPSPEWGEELNWRISFLRKEILSAYTDDLD
jgi:hypothetical protein